jgi:hypothetical protein
MEDYAMACGNFGHLFEDFFSSAFDEMEAVANWVSGI